MRFYSQPAFIIFLVSFHPLVADAQEEDKNVVIENKVQSFSFGKTKGENPVEIQEQYTEQYRCNEVRTSVTFSEMYNENETIRDVDARIDDKKAKGINPTYEYYSVENIFYSRTDLFYKSHIFVTDCHWCFNCPL